MIRIPSSLEYDEQNLKLDYPTKIFITSASHALKVHRICLHGWRKLRNSLSMFLRSLSKLKYKREHLLFHQNAHWLWSDRYHACCKILQDMNTSSIEWVMDATRTTKYLFWKSSKTWNHLYPNRRAWNPLYYLTFSVHVAYFNLMKPKAEKEIFSFRFEALWWCTVH